MRIAVAITANNRPEYLKQVIESWHQVRGIDNVWVIFQVEPGSDDVFELCKNAGFEKQLVKLNLENMTALGNPYVAIESAFSDVGDIDFVLLGEDDSTVTADILEYFAFASRFYYKRRRCLAVCSFQQSVPLGAKKHLVFPRHYFASVVWGTWRNRWDLIRTQWVFDYTYPWDRMLLDKVLKDNYCVFPMISRSQHIGQYGGTHMPPDQFESMQAQQVHDGSPVNYEAIGGYDE